MSNSKGGHAGFAILLTMILAYWPLDAAAYLDPGTGSLMLQAIVAGVFAGLFALKRYIFMVLALVKKPFQKNSNSTPAPMKDDTSS
jgi:hypothetical protein